MKNRQTMFQTGPRLGGKGWFRLNPDFPLNGGSVRVSSRDSVKPRPNISIGWVAGFQTRRGLTLANGGGV